MSLKKIWFKFFNDKKYKELKYYERDKQQLQKFKANIEKEIILIKEKIKKQKILNFYILDTLQILLMSYQL